MRNEKNVLTPKDRRVYEIQWEKVRLTGFAPTIREIALRYGTASHSHILASLKRLVKAGLVHKDALTREGIYNPLKDPSKVDWESLIDGKEAG